MRTTLTIDDQLARTLKKSAQQSGKSFKAIVNETLRAGLSRDRTLSKAKPYRLKPASLGGVKPGIDLNKALALADQLEIVEMARELRMRK